MNASYQIYADLALGVIRLRGRVTGRKLIELLIELYMDSRWRNGFLTLWDGREIRELVMLPEDVDKVVVLAQVFGRVIEFGKVAMVVKRQIDYDVATLLSLMGKMMPCSPFILLVITPPANRPLFRHTLLPMMISLLACCSVISIPPPTD